MAGFENDPYGFSKRIRKDRFGNEESARGYNVALVSVH